MLFPLMLRTVQASCSPAGMEPSDSARAAHAELVRVWGARPKVFRHADEGELNSINIASLRDDSLGGATAVATLGLSDHDLGLGSLRVELVGAFPEDFGEGPNVAATCAFNAFKDGFPVLPDAVHRGVVAMYRPSASVPHILLTDPFLWQSGPATLELDDIRIAWLMMVPIAESEMQFADANGFAELARLMQAADADILDLQRTSVV